VSDDESGGVFSWEFAIGEFCVTRGLQIGSNDPLNLFLYSDGDVAVPASVASVVAQIEATETQLNSLRFADPGL
jgi:hypothetical protein